MPSLADMRTKAKEAGLMKLDNLIAERYGKRIHSWDVVNESATGFGRFGRKAVRKSVFDGSHYGPMPADYAYKAFGWAQKYLPETAWLNIKGRYRLTWKDRDGKSREKTVEVD